MTWYFGTSGWSYKNWDRQFYPKDLPADQKLAHYAKTFSAVEVNTTFYHYLTKDTCRHWASLVPEGFRFSVKLHRYLTQMKKLKLDDKAKAARDRFFESLAELEARTGVILIQLPPSLKKTLSGYRLSWKPCQGATGMHWNSAMKVGLMPKWLRFWSNTRWVWSYRIHRSGLAGTKQQAVWCTRGSMAGRNSSNPLMKRLTCKHGRKPWLP